jgi:hypothetical protein
MPLPILHCITSTWAITKKTLVTKKMAMSLFFIRLLLRSLQCLMGRGSGSVQFYCNGIAVGLIVSIKDKASLIFTHLQWGFYLVGVTINNRVMLTTQVLID